MNTPFLSFSDTGYTYPMITGDVDENGSPVVPAPVFEHFSAELPGGFLSLVGPNASGKSTLMLLAAGRLCPQHGTVTLLGTDTRTFFAAQKIAAGNGQDITVQLPDPEKETEKNMLASFVYQNMEFEDDSPAGKLLEFVFANGGHQNGNLEKKVPGSFFSEVLHTFSLEKLLPHPLSGLSKSETQRVLAAFSVLYGSKSIFMDEPFFAVETADREKMLAYIRSYSSTYHVPVCISMHELELTAKYAEKVLLIYPDRTMELGTPEEVLTNESLEKAYGIPAAMLRETEILNRKTLQENADAAAKAAAAASANAPETDCR